VDAASGIITTVAGNGATGFSGDGGAATSASLFAPLGVAVDTLGNVFIADLDNSRIRRVDAKTGIITTVAGDGNLGFSGDGGPTTGANLVPLNVAVDSQDDLYIADYSGGRVHRVDALSGTINTVVGGGSGGDGSPATSVVLIYPEAVAVDSSGNLLIADTNNRRVRHIDSSTRIISTVAGNGTAGKSASGGAATNSSLQPIGVAVDTQGNVFIADGAVIHRVDAVTEIITTVAGKGNVGFSGDGGPATSASFIGAQAVAVDARDNLFIADMDNQRVRRVDGTTGIITTVAGSGAPNSSGLVPYGFSGDGGPATSAQLAQPRGVALDAHGNLFIADELNSRIRRVDAVTGTISTVAGDGNFAHTGDGSPATNAGIGQVFGLGVDAQDNIFISSGYDVRRVDGVTGIISTVAGGNPTLPGFSGDGGPATSAGLRSNGLAVDAHGRLFIADSTDNRVRVVPLPPFVALSAESLSFTSPAKATTTAAQTITLTNTGLVSLTLSSFAIGGTNAGDFAQTNNCGGSLRAGANCTINVTFTSTEGGSSRATLAITDNAPGSPHDIDLAGTVPTQNKDFSLPVSGSSSSATVTAGGTATYDLSITPLGGLSGAVSVTCGGAPSLATCTASPASVNLSGTAASPLSVTVSTTARSGIVMRPRPPAGPWVWLWIAGLLTALATWMMAARRPVWQRAWVPLAVVLLCAAFWTACGAGNNVGGGGISGTPSGTYTLTVIGNMGPSAPEHQVLLTLKVN
jgi:sugar lactone lactonase YvrE